MKGCENVKLTQDQLDEFIKTQVVPEGATNKDLVNALFERTEMYFGENGETPNKSAYNSYSILLTMIDYCFCKNDKADNVH